MVILTDIAAEKVREFMDGQSASEGVGLRVGVRGGGCSGFQYALALDEKHDDDQIFEVGGISRARGSGELPLRRRLDGRLHRELPGSGFEVSNPNVVASCGCGSSFRVADEEPSCGSAV